MPDYINREWFDVEQELAHRIPVLELTDAGKEHLARSRAFDAALASFSHSSGVPLLVGAPGYVPHGELIENLAILYTPESGQTQPYYLKRQLVPFGEYIPFKDSIPWLHNLLLGLTPVDGDYTLTAGTQWVRFSIPAAGARYFFGTPICYEDVMPYPSRCFVAPIDGRKQVDFLVTISNDGWYQSADELEQHLQMDQLRAVENRVPIARSVEFRLLRICRLRWAGNIAGDRGWQNAFCGGAGDGDAHDGFAGVFVLARGDLFPIGCTIVCGFWRRRGRCCGRGGGRNQE